jgi:hypothetical protein
MSALFTAVMSADDYSKTQCKLLADVWLVPPLLRSVKTFEAIYYYT